MELHTGTIRNGAVVLDDAEDLEDGTVVTVWLERSAEPVRVTDDELRAIQRGQAEAARGECVNARQAIARLREGR